MTTIIGKYGMTIVEIAGWGMGIFIICSLVAFGLVRVIDAVLDRVEKRE